MTTERKHRFSYNFYNGITYSGLILSVFILVCELLLFGIDFFSHNQNSYLGIITYILLPPFLILGLILIPVGAHFKRKRVLKGLEASKPKSLIIDFSLRTHQNAILVFITGTIIVLVLTVIGSYKAFNYTESVQFCGLTCHGIMKPEYIAHEQSPHANVKCVDCHVGSGPQWYMHYKMAGVRMLVKAIDGTYARPIPTPVETLRPAKQICEECHWPGKSFSAIELKRSYFQDDPSKNAPWHLKMLMQVGSQENDSKGIHAHMNYSNDVYYVADDLKHQKISWVKTKDKFGKELIYTTKDSPYKTVSPPESKIRKMDCMDCHNRPSHHFQAPDVLVNKALAEGKINPAIPMVKGKLVELLSKEYKTQDEALSKIRLELMSFYKNKHQEYYTEHRAELEQAMATISAIYQNNFFPEMKARWDVYPDNIGHKISLGCFRCHDDEHKTNEGKVISRDCKSCHIITEQGVEGSIQKSADGIEFQHPFEDDGSWKTMNCSDCHTGGG